jgi:hypothetical protein
METAKRIGMWFGEELGWEPAAGRADGSRRLIMSAYDHMFEGTLPTELMEGGKIELTRSSSLSLADTLLLKPYGVVVLELHIGLRGLVEVTRNISRVL